jgi:flotillin
MHKITGDLTQIAAQVPELFEALSGMKMSDLLGKIKIIGDKSGRTDQLPPPDGADKAK